MRVLCQIILANIIVSFFISFANAATVTSCQRDLKNLKSSIQRALLEKNEIRKQQELTRLVSRPEKIKKWCKGIDGNVVYELDVLAKRIQAAYSSTNTVLEKKSDKERKTAQAASTLKSKQRASSAKQGMAPYEMKEKFRDKYPNLRSSIPYKECSENGVLHHNCLILKNALRTNPFELFEGLNEQAMEAIVECYTSVYQQGINSDPLPYVSDFYLYGAEAHPFGKECESLARKKYGSDPKWSSRLEKGIQASLKTKNIRRKHQEDIVKRRAEMKENARIFKGRASLFAQLGEYNEGFRQVCRESGYFDTNRRKMVLEDRSSSTKRWKVIQVSNWPERLIAYCNGKLEIYDGSDLMLSKRPAIRNEWLNSDVYRQCIHSCKLKRKACYEYAPGTGVYKSNCLGYCEAKCYLP